MNAPSRRSILLLLGGAYLSLGAVAASASPEAPSAILQVGPTRPFSRISEAAQAAKPGAVIEVDAGDYLGDVAVWEQDDITVRAVGGRVRLLAAGASAEHKAIWVVRSARFSVEGFDFIGAAVPDRNGAGIRIERGHVTVRNCTFLRNENGILTANREDIRLEVENSEFGYNGHGDGQSHGLYAGKIGELTVSGSYFHHGKVGHLLKSRAAVNHIRYNRLTDEPGGTASYELEFPAGGLAFVIGNIIQQDSQTENPHIVSYGAEGYAWTRNALYLAHNTLVDKRPSGGVFLRIKPGAQTVLAVNNLFVGSAPISDGDEPEMKNNFVVDWSEFHRAAREDYRLRPSSKLVSKAIDPGRVDGVALSPTSEYVHPHGLRRLHAPPAHPGAVQTLAP